MPFLNDGYQTLLKLTLPAGTPPIDILEKEIQPPHEEVGEVDITTMRNIQWRTKSPKALISAGDITVQARYDPHIFAVSSLAGVLGVNQLMTLRFPDLSGVSFYGWIDRIAPSSDKEGDLPLCEITIKLSNTTNTYAASASPGTSAGGQILLAAGGLSRVGNFVEGGILYLPTAGF